MTSDENLPPRPYNVFREKYLDPLKIVFETLSIHPDSPLSHLHEICLGTIDIDVMPALRPARYFGTTAEYWLDLQKDCKPAIARRYFDEICARVEHHPSVLVHS